MNVRKSTIGFLAAITLALGLAGSALAQPDDTGTTTLLVEGGACTGSIDFASLDFGSYTFNGTDFVPNGSSGKATFSLTVDDNTVSQEGCEIELVASPLIGNNSTSTIPVHLRAETSSIATAITVTVKEGTSMTITASAPSSLSTFVTPDTYTGTITVTGSASQG